MSCQAYLDTIQAKTGLDVDALKARTDAAGLSAGGALGVTWMLPAAGATLAFA